MSDSALPWLRALRPDARQRLVCLPFAGGGTVDYRGWSAGLPPEVDVCPVALPGREARLGERPYDSLESLVAALAPVLVPVVRGVSWALYGHSMGAWIGFELLRTFRRSHVPMPDVFFVASRRAPHLPPRLPVLSGLPDSAFVDAVQDRYGAIPEAIRSNPEILRLFLPTMRADFTLLDRYRYQDEEPLPVPIVAFRGQDDPVEPATDLRAWSEHTSAGFELVTLPGGHFFLRESRAALLDALRERLAPRG
jgi:medium-chain acyl-[acyl-carrier-protein] hydrolase